MSSLVDSVSYPQVALGAAVGLLAFSLAVFGGYSPSLPVAAAVAVLAAVLAARGLLPFGQTVGYYVLQAGAFGLWGVVVLVEESSGARVFPAIFALAGVVGVLYYGQLALRRGPWAPVDG